MQMPAWLRPPKGVHWTPRLAATLVLVVLTGTLALSGGLSVLMALFTFGGDADPAAALANSLKKHEQLAKVDRDRFDGRSAFFMPPAPVRNIPKPPPPPKIEKPLPPPAPVIPAEYGGKKPIAILGPIVYFDNFQIKIGEESNGIKVLSTNAPWSVKLAHDGGEYEVSLWDAKKDDFLNGKWSTTRTLGIESSSAPTLGKDKNATGIGAHMGTPGAPSPGAGDRPSRGNGAKTTRSTPSSPLGSIPSNPQAGRPGPGPGVGNTPSTGLPEGAPPPNEPVQPVPPAEPNPSATPDSPPTPAAPNASSNKGWNSNQMAAPPPFTSEQINGMALTEAVASQATIQKAKSNPALDGATAERLANELSQIAQRINDLKKAQSPPS